MKKAIYRGPWHYWNKYSVNPRERYYYSYYGMYGPYVNSDHYEPIHEGMEQHNESVSNTKNGMNQMMNLGWYVIVFLALYLIFK